MMRYSYTDVGSCKILVPSGAFMIYASTDSGTVWNVLALCTTHLELYTYRKTFASLYTNRETAVKCAKVMAVPAVTRISSEKSNQKSELYRMHC